MPRQRHRPLPVLSLLRRHPALLLLGLLAWGLWYGHETLIARPALSWMGLPAASGWEAATWTRVLRNEGFLVGWSDLRGTPLWALYRLTPVPADAPWHRRPERFARDWRSLNPVGHDDYRGSGYDRGHLAPNYAISRLYGPEAQRATFRMTNIAPQRGALNRKLWQRLEEIEIDVFAPRFGSVWVTAGPVFDDTSERLRNSALVEVPDAFYKILAVPERDGGEPLLLAFLMPQRVQGTEPLDRYLVSVDEVEARTGLDFFSDLDDALEERLESAVAPEPWQLDAVARRPPRY